MDGTLVDSKIDYAAIHKALNLNTNESIVKYLNSLDQVEKEKAQDIVHHFETIGCQKSTLIPGVKNLLSYLQKSNINMAVFTLNSALTAQNTLKMHGLEMSLVITRENAKPKPDPEGLLNICNHFSTPLEDALYVGDYIYDLQAGINANIKTVLYSPNDPEFDYSSAYFRFTHFDELQEYLTTMNNKKTLK